MEKEKFRCHPSIIIEKLAIFFLVIIFLIIYNFDDARMLIEGGMTLKRIVIRIIEITIFLAILIYNIVIWKRTFISIENDAIVVRKNAIFYRKNIYEIKNISNINLEQNILERIMGTYKVKIDIDILSTAEVTDIEIILSKKQAHKFKNRVLQLMDIEKHELKKDESNYIKYSFWDILKHCFFNISMVGLVWNLILVVITVIVSLEADANHSKFAVAVINITALISVIKLFIGDLFKYYNFTINRREDNLYISYGLFKLRKFNVPINRINAINIKQTFISRLCKRYESSIVTIGMENKKSEGSKILLYSSKETFLKNMRTLIPEINVEENLNLKNEHKLSLIIRFFYSIISIIIVNIAIIYIAYIFKVLITRDMFIEINKIYLIIIFLYNCLTYITRGLYVGEQSIAVSRGFLIKYISIISYDKIQYIKLRQKPISSILKLFKGEINILAGLNNEKIEIGYYYRDIYEIIKNRYHTNCKKVTRIKR